MYKKENTVTTKISLFNGKKIRKVIFNNDWWFSVVDVIFALTQSNNPRSYWKILKFRLQKDEGSELVTKCNQLKMIAEDGRIRLTDVASAGKLFLQLRYCAD